MPYSTAVSDTETDTKQGTNMKECVSVEHNVNVKGPTNIFDADDKETVKQNTSESDSINSERVVDSEEVLSKQSEVEDDKVFTEETRKDKVLVKDIESFVIYQESSSEEDTQTTLVSDIDHKNSSTSSSESDTKGITETQQNPRLRRGLPQMFLKYAQSEALEQFAEGTCQDMLPGTTHTVNFDDNSRDAQSDVTEESQGKMTCEEIVENK